MIFGSNLFRFRAVYLTAPVNLVFSNPVFSSLGSRHLIGDLCHLYRYFNRLCFNKLAYIIPPLLGKQESHTKLASLHCVSISIELPRSPFFRNLYCSFLFLSNNQSFIYSIKKLEYIRWYAIYASTFAAYFNIKPDLIKFTDKLILCSLLIRD